MHQSSIIYLWNRLMARRERRGPPEIIAANRVDIQDAVSLGKIIRSPFQRQRGGEPEPDELWLTTEERRKHLYLLGGTGMGKTSLLMNLIRDDVAHHRGVFLMDARGELVDRTLMQLAHYHSLQELQDRLLVIDLRRTDYSVPFNPLAPQGTDAYTRVKFVIEMLKREWALGVQTEQLLRNTLHALSEHHTLNEVEVFLTNPTFRSQVLATVTDLSVKRFFSRFDALDSQSHWVEPVLNKISPWLSRPVLRNCLSQKDSISFAKILDARSDAIILVALGAETLFSDATMIGSLITSAIAGAAMRATRRDKEGNEITLFLDEFSNFAEESEQFIDILSESRKFGLSLCLSHQSSIQLDPKLRSLIRNIVGSSIYFGVGGGEADTLASEIASDEPKAAIRNLLMNQSVGEAVVIRRGKPFSRIKTHHITDPAIAEAKVEALRLSALKRYGRSFASIEAELADREARYNGPAVSNTGSASPTAGADPAPMEIRDYDPTLAKPKRSNARRKKDAS